MLLLQQPPPLQIHPNPPPRFSFHFQFLRHHHHKTLPFLLRSSATDTQTLPQSAIQRIADKLRNLGYVPDDNNNDKTAPTPSQNSAGEIFVPLPNQLPRYRVGHTFDPSWSTPENPVPEPGSGTAIRRYNELRRQVWKAKKAEKENRISGEGRENVRVPTLAELKLPAYELRRLRGLGIKVKKKLKIGKAGITEGIVNGIHERWRATELVKIACDDMCRLNMKRTHDLLEKKTGGLVVWRSGSNIILYRGADYKYPYFYDGSSKPNETAEGASPDFCLDSEHEDKNRFLAYENDVTSVGPDMSKQTANTPLIKGVGSPNRVRFQLPGEAQMVEESDKLLEGLGPRFSDWYGYDPRPVDADLLPAVVPGYRRPFRLLPYGVQPKLTNDEMNVLRRLGRPLPCHFALGRNRKLQGLAAAILKLWEKCEIAKIAVKRGAQNTNSELMAEELKGLTGGLVISRDKEYIVLYRGKDFLPAAVSLAIEQRRKHGVHGVESSTSPSSSNAKENKYEKPESSGDAQKDGTIDPKRRIGSEESKLRSREIIDPKQRIGSEESKLRSHETAIMRTSAKLSQAIEKKDKAEKLLAELGNQEFHSQPEKDKEGITEEERYMLRKLGLKMQPFLLLGRRGVFDGTVENMHLHWKYRELIKILCGERSIEEVHAIARTLEAESGGILVAVERVRKGHAIIVYRGKNYERPASLRPQTLLTKREALKRSIEAQRRMSLKLHVLKLSRNVDELKLKLARNTESIETRVADDLKILSGRESHGSDATSFSANKCIETPSDDLETTLEDVLRECSLEPKVEEEDEFDITEPTALSSLKEESTVVLELAKEKQTSRKEQGIFSIKDEDQSWKEFCTSESTNISSTSPSDLKGKQTSTSPNDLKGKQTSRSEQGIFSMKDEDKSWRNFCTSGSTNLPEFVKETDGFMEKDDESGEAESTSLPTICPGDSMVMDVHNIEHNTYIAKNDGSLNSSIQRRWESESNRNSSGVTPLSNRERLLLRKQALAMRKRPVLAVGRNNMISGVAKTINTHFEKHPLAIVSIKGRAKGTPVQEVVSKLQEATGGILVSMESNKVILYRGWGAKDQSGQKNGNKHTNTVAFSSNSSTREDCDAKPRISPELISAIRLECGLLGKQEGGPVS